MKKINILSRRILSALAALTLLALPAIAVPHTSYGNVTGTGVDNTFRYKFYVANETARITNGSTLTLIGANYRWTLDAGGTPINFISSDVGKDSVAVIWKTTGAGTIDHRSYFAVINETLSNSTPQPYNSATIAEILAPSASPNSSAGRIDLSWTGIPKNPNISETPNSGNVIGYKVYRSTDGINFSQVGTMINNSGSGTVAFQDTTGTVGLTYYYALELVFIGNVVAGDSTSPSPVLSANSAPVLFPSIADTTQPTMTFSPATGATNVALAQDIVVTFSEVMDTSTLTYTLPGATGLSTAWSGGNTILTISHGAFANLTSYTLTITGAKDLAGNDYQGSNSTTFTTVATTTNAPTIGGITWDRSNTDNINNQNNVYGQINITGEGFTATRRTITIGGVAVPAGNIYYWDNTSIQCGVPFSNGSNYITAGDIPVVVTNPNGSASRNIDLRPKINSVTPNSGLVGSSVAIEGTGFGNVAGNISVRFNGIPAALSAGNIAQAADKTTLTVAVPAGATTGSLSVTVNSKPSNTNYDWTPFDPITFTVQTSGVDSITLLYPVGGEMINSGTTPTFTWTSTGNISNVMLELSIDSGANWTTLTTEANDGSYTFAGPISVGATVSTWRFRVSDAADRNPVATSGDFTIVAGGYLVPTISSISPNPARVGETITINGSSFGSAPNGNFVNFGTIQGRPAVWSNTQIILAVPSGVTSGNVTVANSAPQSLNITADKIYLDDYQGGAIDNWEFSYDSNTTPDSGYYDDMNGVDVVYETPAATDGEINNAAIVTDSTRGSKVFKVKYSYPSGSDKWGGGWGAKLANQLDLSAAQSINMALNWDGSANDLTFALTDSDNTTVTYTISGSTLSGLTGYNNISMSRSTFAPDPIAVGTDGFFDWSKVTNYNILHKTKLASSNFASYDDITAVLSTGPVTPETGEVVIISIAPAAAPAGTKATIVGTGFGPLKGLSKLIFQNYIVDEIGRKIITTPYEDPTVLSWSETAIEVIIPPSAKAGKYDVRVIKQVVPETAQDLVRVFQSNDEPFEITANSAGQGGNAIIYPNPFNPMPNRPGAQAVNATSIAFNPGTATNVGVYIYDMTAKLVAKRTINTQTSVNAAVESIKPLGWDGAKALWNGYDLADNLTGDGAYIVRIIDEDSKQLIARGKILVIKRK